MLRSRFIVIIVILLFVVSLPKVQAFDWSGTSIGSGYAVTTDKHGIEVLIGTEVTAWAGTTDPTITEVWFRWLKPGGSEDSVVKGESVGSIIYNGQTVYEFRSPPKIPDELGDWGVQALFYDTDGQGVGPLPDKPEPVAIRARSFNSVPEVPIGTVAILLGMLCALGVFVLKKKQFPH